MQDVRDADMQDVRDADMQGASDADMRLRDADMQGGTGAEMRDMTDANTQDERDAGRKTNERQMLTLNSKHKAT